MRKKAIVVLIALILIATYMPLTAFGFDNTDDLTTKTIDQESLSNNSMKIYGIYMKRLNESPSDTDRYGDATLIESNGAYLLIDTGAKYPIKGDRVHAHPSDLVNTLKSIGVKKLDVLLTHNHSDHVGGIYDVLDNFKVGNVYVSPFTKSTLNVGIESGMIDENNVSKSGQEAVEAKEELIEDIASKGMNSAEEKEADELIENIEDKSIIETIEGTDDILNSVAIQQSEAQNVQLKVLEVGATIKFGSVEGKVLGPVGGYTLEDMYEESTLGTKAEHFTNNMSMSMMFTCGNTKFLTCGDAEQEEERMLIEKYGDELSADILKGSHHGLRRSSIEDFVKIVNPTYSYVLNHGFASGINYEANFRLWQYSRDFIRVANLKNTLIITDNNDRLSINPENDPEKDVDFTTMVKKYGYTKQHTLTVTFNTNGGSKVDAQSILSGGKATKPANPTKTCSTFAGWYSDEELTREFNFNTTISSNITLYAKWTTSHSWNNGTITKNPTCTEKGEKTFNCTRTGCTATKTEEVAAKGHNITSHAFKAATTSANGNTAYWSCDGCKKYFSDAEGQTEISQNNWVIARINASSLALSQTTYQYDGKEKKPIVTVKDVNGKSLVDNTDYTVSYSNNINAGTATATVTFQGNYSGTLSKTFTIQQVKLIEYTTHVQSVGWQDYVSDGKMAGTSGQALRLEGIKIRKGDSLGSVSGSIEYRTHIQSIGWENSWKKDGEMSGTSGQALRLEAIQIRLTGDLAKEYDVYYRVHAQSIGWMGWAKNGESAGTAGYAYRLEGINIVLVEKGEQPPVISPKSITDKCFIKS